MYVQFFSLKQHNTLIHVSHTSANMQINCVWFDFEFLSNPHAYKTIVYLSNDKEVVWYIMVKHIQWPYDHDHVSTVVNLYGTQLYTVLLCLFWNLCLSLQFDKWLPALFPKAAFFLSLGLEFFVYKIDLLHSRKYL